MRHCRMGVKFDSVDGGVAGESQVPEAGPGARGGKGNPTLKTTLAVMKALGVQLTTKASAAA